MALAFIMALKKNRRFAVWYFFRQDERCFICKLTLWSEIAHEGFLCVNVVAEGSAIPGLRLVPNPGYV